MNHNIYIYILVMAAVTYLIRMLPLALSRKEITSPFIKSFLYYVPYACLAAMTFPAILFATEKISVQLHPSPKSLYGNFPIHNVRCRNKEIAVPCSPMRLHGTGCVG